MTNLVKAHLDTADDELFTADLLRGVRPAAAILHDGRAARAALLALKDARGFLTETDDLTSLVARAEYDGVFAARGGPGKAIEELLRLSLEIDAASWRHPQAPEIWASDAMARTSREGALDVINTVRTALGLGRMADRALRDLETAREHREFALDEAKKRGQERSAVTHHVEAAKSALTAMLSRAGFVASEGLPLRKQAILLDEITTPVVDTHRLVNAVKVVAAMDRLLGIPDAKTGPLNALDVRQVSEASKAVLEMAAGMIDPEPVPGLDDTPSPA